LLNNKKGFISIVLFLLIITIAPAALPVIMRAITYHAINEYERAFFNAESGITYYIRSQLLNDNDWSNNAGLGPINFGGGTFSVAVVGPSPRQANKIIIRSTGSVTVGSATFSRTIEQTLLRSSLFSYAAFARGSGGIDVTMSGQAYTDSYNSSIGRYNVNGNKGKNGDVGTNGDIRVSGLAYIDGDASTGPGGSFNNQQAVSGSISHTNNLILPPVTVPSSLSSLPNQGNYSLSGETSRSISGDNKYSSISLSGQSVLTVTGPANIYLTGGTGLSITGQAKLVVSNSSTGPVIVYADQNVSVSGQGIVNNTFIPSNFQLYGTGTEQTFNLSGQADLYAAVYAPNVALSLSGQGGLYGSFVGDTISMSGQAYIHYDEALGSLGGGGGGIVRQNWKEI